MCYFRLAADGDKVRPDEMQLFGGRISAALMSLTGVAFTLLQNDAC